MAVAPFPHRYVVHLENDQLAALPRDAIRFGPPPQFGGGSHEVWGPEDLLVGAVIACAKTTFDAYAARAKLPVRDWVATGTGVLDRGPDGPAFRAIDIAVTCAVDAGREDDARHVFSLVEKHCIVSHALAVPVRYEVVVRGVESPASAA